MLISRSVFPTLLLASCFLLFGQVPAKDKRNTDTPDTDTHFPMRTFASLQEWQEHKAQLRQQILAAAGLLPMPRKTPLNPRITGRMERGDHSIENVLIETLPGFYLAGNLYRPLGKKGKFPGVASPHGHWKHGRQENTAQASIPGRAINLARQGYVVFTYDMVGYNDTKQLEHKFGGRTEQLWSFGPLGLQLWNSIRVVDFLQSLNDVDDGRIAVTGASGGATQSFLLTAVDPRITVAAPVNMVSAIMQGGCECENAPGLRLNTCNVEIAAMMAPKPMLLVAATGDWTKNVPHEEFPAIQKIYALFRRPGNVEVAQMNAGHNYNIDSREAVYRFFARHVLRDPHPAHVSEQSFEVPEEDLMRPAKPEGAKDEAGVFAQWKAMNEPVRSDRVARAILADYLTVQWPKKVRSEIKGEKIALSRVGMGDRVVGLWHPGKSDQRIALVIYQDGAEAARKQPEVERMIQAGRPVLLIDMFQTGSVKNGRNRSHKFFTTFNQTDDAARIQDILTALNFLRTQPGKGIDLLALNGAAPVCVFAAAAAPIDLRLYANLGNFKGTDDDFIRQLFVPGIQRAGGLATALRLAKPLPWSGT